MALGNVDFSQLHAVLQQGEPAGPYATLAAAQEAGAVTLNWGAFINAILSFLIVAFSVFMVVRSFNKMRAEQEAPAEEAPPEPSAEETLLGEIRDLLKAGG